MQKLEWDKVKVNKINKAKLAGKIKSRFAIPWKSEIPKEQPVYEIPLELLSYNSLNTRIRAELEGEFGKEVYKLDSNNERIIKFIEKILLTSKWIGNQKSELLKNDLNERGQIDPAVATPEGKLIDGNRRLVLLRKLHEENPKEEKFSHMKVCILEDDDEEITQDDLKELEMRIQMYQTFRVDYGDINISLEFRNLHENLGWGLDKIAKLTGEKFIESKIEKMIKIIKIIDQYLEVHHIPKKYITVDKKWESFENLYRILNWTEKEEKTNPDKNIIKDNRMYLGFKIIHKDGSTYRNIREFSSILRNSESKKKLERDSVTLNGEKLTNFSDSHVDSEFKIVQQCGDHLNDLRQEPALIAEIALNKLKTIKISRIDEDDKKFTKILDEILQRIKYLQGKR